MYLSTNVIKSKKDELGVDLSIHIECCEKNSTSGVDLSECATSLA